MPYCPTMVKIAIIAGCRRGISAETARRAATAGYDVCANYVANTTAADRVIAECEAFGRKAFTVKADVGNAGNDRFGRVSLLLNNAGIVGQVATAANPWTRDLPALSRSTSTARSTARGQQLG